MLKVNADLSNRDYLDYLVPFIGAVLHKHRHDPVRADDVKKGIRDEFGLKIPVGPVDLVLRRLAKRSVLRSDRGVYYVDDKYVAPDLAPRQAEARASNKKVIAGLIKFAGSKHGEQFDENRAVDAITAYLGRFCIECLETYAEKTALPSVPATESGDLYIVNAFIREALQADSEVFDAVVVLVKGHMLANALICPDLEAQQRKFGDVTLFLDTPFVLRLFRVQGDAHYEAANELIELLKKLKARLAIFHHTVQEVHQVLKSCDANLENPAATSRIVMEMRKAGKTRADLVLIQSGLERFLDEHEIVRTPAPKYTIEFQIDETILGDTLDEEVKYWNSKALEYDVNSIRSIYQLRKGLAPTRLETARAVLVSPNFRLARVAYEYGKKHEATREVSSVITDFSLGNIAWLKAPVGSDFPRLEIIAHCYAAMEPSLNLWLKYLSEIKKLKLEGRISTADHEALRVSYRAREELMNLTLGEERAFSASTIADVLEIVKNEMTREKQISLDRERKAHKQTKAHLASLQSQRDKQRKMLFWKSKRTGRIASIFVLVTSSVILVVAALAATEKFGPYFRDRWSTGLLNLIIGVAIVWGLLNLILGLSIRQVSIRLSDKLGRVVYRYRCKVAGLSPKNGDR